MRSEIRKQESRKRKRLKNDFIRCYVMKKLMIGWSPEQIAGRITLEYPEYTISHEAIYEYVYDKEVRKQIDLVQYLARSHRKRYPRGHMHKHRKTHIPNRISIDSRPKHIQKRNQIGHWEADAMVSRQSAAALCVSVERKTRMSKITKLKRKGAREFSVAINRSLSHYPKNIRRSITYDNGCENVEHQRVNEVLKTKSYFCNPYHSWEKGTVENTNGLVRRYLPKKTDFDKIPKSEIKNIERRLNNRPRKCLNFRTPLEVLELALR